MMPVFCYNNFTPEIVSYYLIRFLYAIDLIILG